MAQYGWSPETIYYCVTALGLAIGLVCACGFYFLIEALRSGSIITTLLRGRHGGVTIRRDENPIGFWLTFALSFAGMMIGAGLAYLFLRYPLGAHDQLSVLSIRIKW